MKDLITINNLNFSYNKKAIFKNLNLQIKKGQFITILGSSGSGKTTLTKILSGKLNCTGDIVIDDLNLRDALNKKKVTFCFDSFSNNFIQDKVIDELYVSLKKNNLSRNEINSRVNYVVNNLKIDNLLDYSPIYLSNSEKQIVSLAKQLVLEPDILILDDSLLILDSEQRKIIFKYLKKLNRDKKTTIINITGNSEDSIYGNDIAIIHDGNIIINDKKQIVLLEEKLFKKAGLSLPFMADLSIKLKYYDLFDKIILDKNKMVNLLWK